MTTTKGTLCAVTMNEFAQRYTQDLGTVTSFLKALNEGPAYCFNSVLHVDNNNGECVFCTSYQGGDKPTPKFSISLHNMRILRENSETSQRAVYEECQPDLNGLLGAIAAAMYANYATPLINIQKLQESIDSVLARYTTGAQKPASQPGRALPAITGLDQVAR